MKKYLISILLLAMGGSCLAQSWVVEKNRKGQAVMDYAYYEQLQNKAAQYDSLQAEIARLNGEVMSLRNRVNHRTPIISFNDSASYAIGRDLYNGWKNQELDINVEAVAQSLRDSKQGQNTWDEPTLRQLLQKFQRNFEARQQANLAKQQENAKANIEAGKKFLAENAKSKAVYTTKSGL
ncbi:MAG: FKBP-type peptidyl-prolyl cis-trans isomerase N-terminal domain-containing protein, partial [Bacteroidales bacterium]|nr:FKBP-type peptidyl-prolyl cis-trans isomerase N-terminal domain-containing protein [Bacteroidales bacterium]